MDLIDIFRTFYPNAEEYTFFSGAHGTFSRIDHILGHKSNLIKKLKSHQASSPTTMWWDWISVTRKKTVRNPNTWTLNNTFLNNQQVTEEIKKFPETNDNENMTTQNLWDVAKSSSKKEVYNNTILPQETRKTSNRQSNFTPKTTWKEQQQKKTPKLVEGKES